MSTIRNLSLRVKLFGGFGVVVAVMGILVGAALVTQSQMASATDHITNVTTPKTVAGHEITYTAADLVGWQEAYVLDRGKSRPAFLHSAAMFRIRLAHLQAVSVDPADLADAKAIKASSRPTCAPTRRCGRRCSGETPRRRPGSRSARRPQPTSGS